MWFCSSPNAPIVHVNNTFYLKVDLDGQRYVPRLFIQELNSRKKAAMQKIADYSYQLLRAVALAIIYDFSSIKKLRNIMNRRTRSSRYAAISRKLVLQRWFAICLDHLASLHHPLNVHFRLFPG